MKYYPRIIIILLVLISFFSVSSAANAQSVTKKEKLAAQFKCLSVFTELKNAQDLKAPAAKIEAIRQRYQKEQSAYNKLLSSYADPDAKTGPVKMLTLEGKAPAGQSSLILDVKGPLNHNYNFRNTCGQFAINSVLNYYGVREEYTTTAQNTNPNGCFTAPDTIIKYLASRGIGSNVKNNATLGDLKTSIDANNPVFCYVGVGNIPHWIVVIGYDLDATGEVSALYMRDAYWGSFSNYKTSKEIFLQIWEEPIGQKIQLVKDKISSYRYYMIAPLGAGTATEIPTGTTCKETALDDKISEGVAEMVMAVNQDVSWIAGIKSLQELRKFDISKIDGVKFMAGAVKAISAIPAKLVEILQGTPVRQLGEQLIAAGTGSCTNGTCGQSSTILTGVGNTLKNVGTIAETASSKITGIIGRLFKI